MDRVRKFISNEFVWKTSLLNAVLCACMTYFYFDSGIIAPVFYAAFFLSYPVVVFIAGPKAIPVLYVIYSIGAIQDITFINCTVFLIFMFLSWQFPKWKYTLAVVYILEAVIVCMRHSKTPAHLVFHVAYCIVLYIGADIVKRNIEKAAILKVSEHFKPLDLKPEEEEIIKQRAAGKLMKEITCYSKNTRTTYIQNAMKRNDCKTPEELIAVYSMQQRII